MPRPKRSLTLKQLDAALAHFPRMSPEAREIARLVLVEGKTNQRVADKIGKSKQFVNDTVVKVYDTYITKVAKRPKGWIRKEWCLPPELIEKVDDMEAHALKEHLSKNK